MKKAFVLRCTEMTEFASAVRRLEQLGYPVASFADFHAGEIDPVAFIWLGVDGESHLARRGANADSALSGMAPLVVVCSSGSVPSNARLGRWTFDMRDARAEVWRLIAMTAVASRLGLALEHPLTASIMEASSGAALRPSETLVLGMAFTSLPISAWGEALGKSQQTIKTQTRTALKRLGRSNGSIYRVAISIARDALEGAE